jgi:hypothetical protein
MGDPTSPGGADDAHARERQRHDRRYKMFAAAFAAVVLLFAALSITIVIVAS